MPTVEFKTDELIELTGIKDINLLRERIPLLGVDLECIDSEKATMEIFPNRPDMLSVEGFARALRNFLGVKKHIDTYIINRVTSINNKIFVDSSVKQIRPFISSAILKNLNFTDAILKSLMNIQEKLHITHGRNRKKIAIGIHDLDAIKFPVTYKAVKPHECKFIPLNFASNVNNEMYLDEILKLHPKGMEYGKILYLFDHFPIIVDTNDDVISMPPIINADRTKVTETTKNLFVEVTGTNAYAVEKALAIIVCTLVDRGGEIYDVKVQCK